MKELVLLGKGEEDELLLLRELDRNRDCDRCDG